MGQAGGAEEEKKPEKTVFELKLESYEAASKIKVIKEVRSFTDLEWKEAKDLVERWNVQRKRRADYREDEGFGSLICRCFSISPDNFMFLICFSFLSLICFLLA
ncbi:hypothetical protein QQ045_011685 [Rhodiola kirilowii]